MTRNRILTPLFALLAALALAACGSSKAPGVQTAPSGGSTQAAVTAPPQTTSTPTTPTATTPKPPSPLSRKPAVNVPGGSAPRNLVVRDLVKGTGPTAANGSNVTVNYVGVLFRGGKEFDSSWKSGHPISFKLSSGPGGVISGWARGIPGMRVGGRRELIIPPNLGYGTTGSPPQIPGNASLVFVVDLLGVS
jgi:FKBP-type peptidyl-prolyl cis-trans isomerase